MEQRHTKKAKERNTIRISGTELKNIMSQFSMDILTDSEQCYQMKKAVEKLNTSDKIIFCLYSELQSERKVADILGVSRSPIHKLLQNIKNQILTNLENQK